MFQCAVVDVAAANLVYGIDFYYCIFLIEIRRGGVSWERGRESRVLCRVFPTLYISNECRVRHFLTHLIG